MSERYKSSKEPAYYYMTCTVVGWIDVFSRDIYRQILIDSLKFCIANKGLHVNAYVIMTNHIHLIGWAEEGCVLSEIMRDFKRHTGKKIIEAIQSGVEVVGSGSCIYSNTMGVWHKTERNINFGKMAFIQLRCILML